jgi:hypothetical protein
MQRAPQSQLPIAGDNMNDRKQPRLSIDTRRPSAKSSASNLIIGPSEKRRPDKELESIVDRLAENGALVARLDQTIGSANAALVDEVKGEITRHAESRSTINGREGSRIVILLAKKLGRID